jgi:2-polyprenyl-6-hydroxyphenyl methylase / 3-demethylubiquinone-9 3-methyltransferase
MRLKLIGGNLYFPKRNDKSEFRKPVYLPDPNNQIDNLFYDSELVGWWDKESPMHLMKVLLNPVRISYIKRKLTEYFPLGFTDKTALEVGCGGGILSEDIARLGIEISGIDPSEKSIICAIRHAKENDLQIKYQLAEGENLPFISSSFDIVFCCDVLEHVRDLSKVISEISRVLKPGGIFIYDTINRTFFSFLIAIKLLQHWERWALLPANLHVWNKFIRPAELKELLFQNNLVMKENKGIVPDISPFKIIHLLYQRKLGKLPNSVFGTKFFLIESRFLGVSYMGYAIKNN